MKVLVVGRGGQVARALVKSAAKRGVRLDALGRPHLDIATNDVAEIIAARHPDVVINTAAYTAVDAAESDQERAFAINALGAERVALGAARANALLIHLSTDYVFSGDKGGAYREGDAPAPSSVYGASKLEGEKRVGAVGARSIIVRAAWVYDAEGTNFVRTMLRLARKQASVDVVGDQRGCPTFASDLAEGLLDVAARAVDGEGELGVYHCAGAGEASRAEFATDLFELSKAAGGPVASVRTIRTEDYPTPAARPPNAALDCDKLARAYGVRLRPWREALAACVDEIASAGWSAQ